VGKATGMRERFLVPSSGWTNISALEELCALVLVLDYHPHAIGFLQLPEVVVLILAIRGSGFSEAQ
jgi:hypothetical protein